MTTLLELVNAEPADTHGVVTQIQSGDGVWRFVVELADPGEGSSVVWHDITSYVSGLEVTRGADEYAGRYRATVAELELITDDDGLSPTSEDTSATFGTHVELGAGLLIRGGLIRVVADATVEWLPRFTTRVETWGNASHARGQIRRHRITTRDLITELVNTPVAADLEDNWYDRAVHVLTESDWAYDWAIFGAALTSGAADILTEPDVDESENAIAELDRALDPAGIIWYTDRVGRIIARPQVGDTFHADAFTAGATGTPWTGPAAVGFHYNAEDVNRCAYIDDDANPFGISDTELAVVNRIRVSDPVNPTPYDTSDPVSQGRYGNRARSVSWVAANDAVADDILARLAFATRQATPIETSIDHQGFFPLVAALDFLHPVNIRHRTGDGRLVTEAAGVVRQISERFAPRAGSSSSGTGAIDWSVSIVVDIDTTSEAAELLPVEDLAVDDVTDTSAEFSWTNPTQVITPTETWVRIPQQSQLWLELDYPITGLEWLGLEPDTVHQFDVRLIRRVDGLVTAASPIRSVLFTTDPSPAPIVTPDGGGGFEGELPPAGPGCVIDWVLSSTDDGTTWTTVTSGTAAGGAVILIDGSLLDTGLTYRMCATEVCGGVPGTEYCSPVVVPVCQTPPEYPGTAPYDRSDLIMFVPEFCSPDIVVEAVTDTAGHHGPAWGGFLSIDVDELALASDTGLGGIIAHGEASTLSHTGSATIGCRASVQTVESSRLVAISGLRISAVAGTTGWYPSASVTTLFGENITVTDTTEQALITPLELIATYDAATGTLILYVDGNVVATDTAEDPTSRAAAGPYWYVGAPTASYITNCAAWSSVFVPTPGTVSLSDDFNRANGALGADWTLAHQHTGVAVPAIVSNTAAQAGTDNAFSFMRNTLGPLSTDDVELTWTAIGPGSTTTRSGIWFCGGPNAIAGGCFLVYWERVSTARRFYVARYDSGVLTAIHTQTGLPSLSGGAPIVVSYIGGILIASFNGVQYYNGAQAAPTGGGRHVGLFLGNGASGDNFTAEDT